MAYEPTASGDSVITIDMQDGEADRAAESKVAGIIMEVAAEAKPDDGPIAESFRKRIKKEGEDCVVAKILKSFHAFKFSHR